MEFFKHGAIDFNDERIQFRTSSVQCIKCLHFKTADKPDKMCEIGDVEQDIVSNVLVEHLRIVHLALERELANLLQYTAFYKFVQVGMDVDFVFLADVNMFERGPV